MAVQVWGKTGGKLYGQRSGADFSDNQKRFVLFNKAAVEALTALPFSPGEDCVVVANDWHTAMFPVLLKVSNIQIPVVLHQQACVHWGHPSTALILLAPCIVASTWVTPI